MTVLDNFRNIKEILKRLLRKKEQEFEWMFILFTNDSWKEQHNIDRIEMGKGFEVSWKKCIEMDCANYYIPLFSYITHTNSLIQ